MQLSASHFSQVTFQLV
uniref:Uncharacterized protein n=1 Tax=Anguilla anguilla TaxID=7936 RepID=A0A0E9QU78_ANGAN